MSGQVYAVASGKGGVGKTMTTVNLGVTLRSDGHSVVLVDADLGMANLATLFDVTYETTLHDVLAGDATVMEALSEEATGFAILPGTRELSGYAAADPDRLDDVLKNLAESYEYVLVDTGGGLSYEEALPLGMVDDILLVTTPDASAVGDTNKTKELADLVGGHIRGVVVNRAIPSIDPETIADQLGTTLLGAIPQDQNVAESTLACKPIMVHAPDSPAAEAFDRLAALIASEAPDNAAMEDLTILEGYGEDKSGPTEVAANEQSTETPDEIDRPVSSVDTSGSESGVTDRFEFDAKEQEPGVVTMPETNQDVGVSESPENNDADPGTDENGREVWVDDGDEGESKSETTSDGIFGWLSRVFS